jgi:hypothetical protein
MLSEQERGVLGGAWLNVMLAKSRMTGGIYMTLVRKLARERMKAARHRRVEELLERIVTDIDELGTILSDEIKLDMEERAREAARLAKEQQANQAAVAKAGVISNEAP